MEYSPTKRRVQLNREKKIGKKMAEREKVRMGEKATANVEAGRVLVMYEVSIIV